MKFLRFIAAAVVALALVACNDNGKIDDPAQKSNFRVETNASWVQIGVDHAYFLVYLNDELVDPAELTFYDENDEEVKMTPYEVEIDGVTVTVPEWIPTEPATKSFMAMYKSYYNKELVSITAVDFALPESMEDPQPDNVSFVKRTFFNQHTGAGCGYCPYAKAALYEVAADEMYGDKFINAAIYTFNTSEKLFPQSCGNIGTVFGINSWPTIVVDMNEAFGTGQSHAHNVENIKTVIDRSQAEDAKAGIAVNVASDEGDTFVARVSVKAAVDGEYHVGAWLVEDGLSETQANYGCTEPYDYNTHNAVLRHADSGKGYYGHALGVMKAGEVKDQVFAMTFVKDVLNKDGKVVKPGWVKENCRLIVFVTTKSNGRIYVTNSVTNDIFSDSIPFEYK